MIKMKTLSSAATALVLTASLLSGCSLYRPDLRQGNSISQEELNKLHANQSKHEVQEIMGSPASISYINLDQWNYTYAYLDGTHRDQLLKFKTISLFFKDDKLQSYSSKYWKPANLPTHK
ncbi:MAG TPA: outer membrane protein assembly factor BamE [Gammaproteobacteria bacterium]|nr:outer membrane protein assembly factor BamE [Gammaproteobacteria bacterium]